MMSERDAGKYLADMFDFPEYVGTDLESVYDALVDLIEPVHVVITNRTLMETTDFGSKLIWVFEDAASDSDALKLSFM